MPWRATRGVITMPCPALPAPYFPPPLHNHASVRCHAYAPALADGPETATQLGAANIAVLHHVGASGARKAWSDAVSGTSGVEVKFSASDALVVVMPSDIVAALPAMTKYTPLHTSPLKAVERDARLSSIADKNGIKDPIIEVPPSPAPSRFVACPPPITITCTRVLYCSSCRTPSGGTAPFLSPYVFFFLGCVGGGGGGVTLSFKVVLICRKC